MKIDMKVLLLQLALMPLAAAVFAEGALEELTAAAQQTGAAAAIPAPAATPGAAASARPTQMWVAPEPGWGNVEGNNSKPYIKAYRDALTFKDGETGIIALGTWEDGGMEGLFNDPQTDVKVTPTPVTVVRSEISGGNLLASSKYQVLLAMNGGGSFPWYGTALPDFGMPGLEGLFHDASAAVKCFDYGSVPEYSKNAAPGPIQHVCAGDAASVSFLKTGGDGLTPSGKAPGTVVGVAATFGNSYPQTQLLGFTAGPLALVRLGQDAGGYHAGDTVVVTYWPGAVGSSAQDFFFAPNAPARR
jgi:hypothetical protein